MFPKNFIKTTRSARLTQSTKLLQEARSLPTEPNTDNPKLTGFYDRFAASNDELLNINEAHEAHLADEKLETEYVAAAEYNNRAISMIA